MGAQNSNLRKSIEKDFAERTARTGHDWLNLNDILNLQPPQSSWSISLLHLGVLYVLDKEHDGRFTLQNVLDMLQLGREQSRLHQPHEFAAQISGYCTLQMWQAVALKGGVTRFSDWLSRLLLESMAFERFAKYPGIPFLGRDSLRLLHSILDVEENQQLDFQAFFDLLQRAAEANGQLDAGDESLRDWLPLPTVQALAVSIGEGIVSTAKQICPLPHDYAADN